MYGVKAVTEKNQGEMIDILIGQRVRQQREALGLSIRGLASAMAAIMSDTGKAMGPGKLLSLEKGRYRWNTKLIAAAAQALEIPEEMAAVLQLPPEEASLVMTHRAGGLGGVAAWTAERRGR